MIHLKTISDDLLFLLPLLLLLVCPANIYLFYHSYRGRSCIHPTHPPFVLVLVCIRYLYPSKFSF
ncbi:hypothetical protein BDV98DRAFT_569484 [Pterulicium gracile]|uniref:Uncharacterized protein n=1 Tax=Pterulicium gracile TaxID=1884261 RepID=A0A5C3QPI6_9AGAR|nr:hypothetical protein BDV98DRAFT_569484 [Pterula gracilis]